MDPSVKGSAVLVAAEQLRELAGGDAVSAEQARAALGPEWAALVLDGHIDIAQWYPARLYDQLLTLMMNTVGGGKPEYLVESGRQAAAALAEKGVYRQLERQSDGSADASGVRRIITLSKAIYNFTTWELTGCDFEHGHLEITISGAAAYPDSFVYRNAGFLEKTLLLTLGEPWQVRFVRSTPDTVQLSADRAARPAGAALKTAPKNSTEKQPKEKPGIKGSVFAAVADAVIRLREKGRVTAEELEVRLSAEGVACLEGKIVPSSWYPIEVYGRMRELLRDVEGGGDDQYTVASAAQSARRLIDSGVYQQLSYLERWQTYEPSGNPDADAAERRRLFRQQLKMVSTLYNALYNFGNQKVTIDPEFPDRFRLEYWDGGVMPRACRFAVLGFWSEMALSWSSGRGVGLWRLEHATDHYVLRMTRDVADL